MESYKLPLGVQDLLPDEQFNLNEIEAKLKRVFEGAGCQFVSTAILDYYDTYSDISNRIPQEKMFKFTDNDGKLLVLRPDMTLSLARMATKHKIGSDKLCYVSPIWNAAETGGLSAREVLQAGVECFGRTGAFADAEIVALAIDSLLSVGLKDFILDIGHVGFFKSVLEESGFSRERTEEVRAFVNAKNIIGAERLVKGTKAEAAISALPTLFGGEEVFLRAEKLTSCTLALSAISHLKQVYDLLVSFGYGKYISVDLGTVKSLSYYSGVVFTGLSGVIGAPVLSGGRYDNLAKDFSSDFPAVGFAIGLKRLLVALERQGTLVKAPGADLIVAARKGAEKEAFAFCRKKRAEGKKVDLFAGTEEEAMAYFSEKTGEKYLVTKEEVQSL